MLTIPENLDLQRLFLEREFIDVPNGDRSTDVRRWRGKELYEHYKKEGVLEKMYLLVSDIQSESLERGDKHGFVSMSLKLLQQRMSKRLPSKLLNILSELAVIESKNHLKLGEEQGRCRVYRVNEVYRLANWIPYKASSEFLGIDTYTRRLLFDPQKPEYKFLLKSLDNCRFNFGEAASIISQFRAKSYEFSSYNHQKKLKQLESSVVKIQNNDHRFKVIKVCGRIQTTHANMSKMIRGCLTDNRGYKLDSIDFSSSHAHQLVYLFKHMCATIYDDQSLMRYKAFIPDSVKLEHRLWLQETDQILMRCFKGGLYEWIAKEYKRDHGYTINARHKSGKTEREVAKYIWNVCFLNGGYKNWSKAKWIKSKFPAISVWIETFNSTAKKSGKRMNLAIHLMTNESKLLNDYIFRRIARELSKSNIVIIGLYDGCLVDRKHYNKVFKIFQEEWLRFFGWKACIKGKRFLKKHDVKFALAA